MRFFCLGLVLIPGLLFSQEPKESRVVDPSRTLPKSVERIDRSRYLIQPRIKDLALSPDGIHLAALLRGARGEALRVLECDSFRVVKETPLHRATSIQWTTDSQSLVIESKERLALLALDASRPRLIATLDTQMDQRYLGVDSTQPQQVLVSEKDQAGVYRLLRIGPKGTIETLFESEQPLVSFLLDDLGELEFLLTAPREVQGSLETAVIGFEGEGERREWVRCDPLDPCLPVGADGAQIFLRARFGRDRVGLWSIDRATGARQLVHKDPQQLADLSSVEASTGQGTPMMVVYDTDYRRVYGLDPETESRLKALRRRFDGSNLGVKPSAGKYWLLTESGAHLHHPQYFLFNINSGHLEPVLQEERSKVSPIPSKELSRPRWVSYEASDGMKLYGWIYTPRAESLADRPVVVKVHGGPWNHVRYSYSALTQLLVNRGYVVFEPNFRGSTGYGWRYLKAANYDFGHGRVQQDILEGLDWLLAEGVGDEDRVAMIGHSFGGFSTLVGLAFTPTRFRAGVASAPPIDLVRSFRDLDGEVLLGNGLTQKAVVEELLLGGENPETVERELRKNSPESHLADTVSPLLLIAGGRDEKIDIVDVKHYAQALHTLKRDVSLIVDESLGHSLDSEVARLAYLTAVEQFLAAHLGGESQSSITDEVKAYFKSNVILKGNETPISLQ